LTRQQRAVEALEHDLACPDCIRDGLCRERQQEAARQRRITKKVEGIDDINRLVEQGCEPRPNVTRYVKQRLKGAGLPLKAMPQELREKPNHPGGQRRLENKPDGPDTLRLAKDAKALHQQGRTWKQIVLYLAPDSIDYGGYEAELGDTDKARRLAERAAIDRMRYRVNRLEEIERKP
jgi:predicted DsbA family dithiol-disulfide isomerase